MVPPSTMSTLGSPSLLPIVEGIRARIEDIQARRNEASCAMTDRLYQHVLEYKRVDQTFVDEHMACLAELTALIPGADTPEWATCIGVPDYEMFVKKDMIIKFHPASDPAGVGRKTRPPSLSLSPLATHVPPPHAAAAAPSPFSSTLSLPPSPIPPPPSPRPKSEHSFTPPPPPSLPNKPLQPLPPHKRQREETPTSSSSAESPSESEYYSSPDALNQPDSPVRHRPRPKRPRPPPAPIKHRQRRGRSVPKPAPHTAAPAASRPQPCVRCRRRKVGCDKQEPCSRCVKHGLGMECKYPKGSNS
ncbi:hypothetical protein QBC34DRAFT_411757 [Podospora aff. communis PSN243]|uniref:Zn(2)-C6 fungal-type domain-containing protein n=1 Tax=Podospora aff. communis PSN243 TaxID=3040156 RepID=A0AAV9GDH8_9PEZI|nr:hypothetical protein QBC34DRAFT_411757 [Podospora aff. communis PSN243]